MINVLCPRYCVSAADQLLLCYVWDSIPRLAYAKGRSVHYGHCPTEVGGAVLGRLDNRAARGLLLVREEIPNCECNAHSDLRNPEVDGRDRVRASVGAGGGEEQSALNEQSQVEDVGRECHAHKCLVADPREEGRHQGEKHDRTR